MVVMYILISIIFICIGIIMLINPEIIFRITESWKNDSYTEPSKIYIISTRFGGCMFLIIGLLGLLNLI